MKYSSKKCIICGVVFKPKSSIHICCSKKCGVIYRRNHQNELTKLSREIGNCPCCAKPKDNHKYLICSVCRKASRDYHKKRQEAKNESKN